MDENSCFLKFGKRWFNLRINPWLLRPHNLYHKFYTDLLPYPKEDSHSLPSRNIRLPQGPTRVRNPHFHVPYKFVTVQRNVMTIWVHSLLLLLNPFLQLWFTTSQCLPFWMDSHYSSVTFQFFYFTPAFTLSEIQSHSIVIVGSIVSNIILLWPLFFEFSDSQ